MSKRNKKTLEAFGTRKAPFMNGFAKMSPEARKVVLDNLKTKNPETAGFDVKGFADELTEGLNLLIQYHPICEVLERLSNNNKLTIPEDILELTANLDKSIATYLVSSVNISALIDEISVRAQMERAANPRLPVKNTNKRLLNLLYQNPISEQIPLVLDLIIDIQNNVVDPVMEYMAQYKSIVDEEYNLLKAECGLKSDYECRKKIHMDRVSKYIDLQEA